MKNWLITLKYLGAKSITKSLNAHILLPVYLLRSLSLISKYTEIFHRSSVTDNCHNSPVIFLYAVQLLLYCFLSFPFVMQERRRGSLFLREAIQSIWKRETISLFTKGNHSIKNYNATVKLYSVEVDICMDLQTIYENRTI